MREICRSCPVHFIPALQKTVLAGTNAGAGETDEKFQTWKKSLRWSQALLRSPRSLKAGMAGITGNRLLEKDVDSPRWKNNL